MKATYYHAGPKGLTTLVPLGKLIRSGIYSVEKAQEMWVEKWGEEIEVRNLLSHPTLKEVSLTTDLEEAKHIAGLINGEVYRVVCKASRINEEGYPVFRGSIACEVAR